MDSFSLIIRIAQFSSLIPIAVGITKYNSLPKTGKLFFFFMIFSACTEGIAYILARLYNNNMPFLYVFTFVEFSVFSYILLPRLALFADKFKPLLWGGLLLMLALMILDVFVQSFFKWNTISQVAECILIVFMGLAYLLQYIQSDSNVKITRDYVFWIATGATLYFCIAFFFFTMINILLAINTDLARLAKYFHLFACIISYILYAVSFWVIRKKQ